MCKSVPAFFHLLIYVFFSLGFFHPLRHSYLRKMFDYPFCLCSVHNNTTTTTSANNAVHNAPCKHSRVGSSNFGPSPLSSRHGSQESLRHLNTMGSMSMLQTPTSSVCRDPVSAAQKKKSIKSSLGRFFSKKEKVNFNDAKFIL